MFLVVFFLHLMTRWGHCSSRIENFCSIYFIYSFWCTIWKKVFVKTSCRQVLVFFLYSSYWFDQSFIFSGKFDTFCFNWGLWLTHDCHGGDYLDYQNNRRSPVCGIFCDPFKNCESNFGKLFVQRKHYKMECQKRTLECRTSWVACHGSSSPSLLSSTSLKLALSQLATTPVASSCGISPLSVFCKFCSRFSS